MRRIVQPGNSGDFEPMRYATFETAPSGALLNVERDARLRKGASVEYDPVLLDEFERDLFSRAAGSRIARLVKYCEEFEDFQTDYPEEIL